ncbi:TLC domain-containing protein [Phanerochaete sordida]|uniref:TLC domain-containing protein n=1 Tax=Phanerochaete sordida TaxID=48140 RepID=A0A9P3GSW3_9APHY|nr:TLC domain-containing protein [Phanerochaete sordida]
MLAPGRVDALLQRLAQPLARGLDLPHLPPHFPLVAYSALGFTAVHVALAPLLSRWLAPESYGKLKGRRARNNWNIHIVSLVHAVAIIALALRAFNQPALAADKVFGWHETAEVANSVALGYFIWDTIDAIVNFTDLGFVLHGLACVVTYSLTFTPYLQYFSCRFLLWELSTPFLNIHWFLDKTGRTGSTLQLVNGILLLSTFFFVRIVYGWYISVTFWRVMFARATRDAMPRPVWAVFLLGHATLTLLNLLWLSKMVRALRRRFDDPEDLDKQPLLGSAAGLAAAPPADADTGVRPPTPPRSASSSPPRNYTSTDPVRGAA